MSKQSKRLHFIAIGGAAMHNLALALANKGFSVTGSDDEINEPSFSRLKTAGLLPDAMGWFAEKIEDNLDGVILGMHARADNPELIAAKEKVGQIIVIDITHSNSSSIVKAMESHWIKSGGIGDCIREINSSSFSGQEGE